MRWQFNGRLIRSTPAGLQLVPGWRNWYAMRVLRCWNCKLLGGPLYRDMSWWPERQ